MALAQFLLLAGAPLAAQSTTPAAPTELTAGTVIGPALRATDLDRSIAFYTNGMGMVVARKIDLPTGTEIALTFGANMRPPVIMLFKSKDPAKSGPIVMGNGYGRTLIAVADADALAARLKAAGFAPGEVKSNAVNNMKTFWVSDPDGYAYEITQMPTGRN
jgi:catechol 2,3-dioxygenase-like lactoylglutathione lyase family enzyme